MARLNTSLIRLAAFVCALGATALGAATHPVVVQFSPALPLAGQTVTARLSNGLSKACWPPATSITRVNADITIQLDYDDACPAQYLMPFRDYILGAFPADNYNLIVISCSNNPPPFPSECNVVLQAPFSVLAPRPVEPAPVLSPWVMLALLAGLIAATAVHLRSIRYRRRK
ncbi:MAG TPA: hypothetical protein VFI49_16210 [Rudaea sp.]|nr:hypothetical protein [Rudaea sp.]